MHDPRPVRPPVADTTPGWVLIRDPQKRFKAQALLSTNLAHTPEQMLTWFVQRWTLEVTFEEARAHLGMETQRHWSERAIARTTPALLSLYSIVTLTAQQLIDRGETCMRRTAWYSKRGAHFQMRLPWCGGSSGSISIFQRPNRRPK